MSTASIHRSRRRSREPAARRPSRTIPLVLAFLQAACASGEGDTATCLHSDASCIEDARVAGVDVVLVDEAGNPVDPSGEAVEDSSRATIPGEDPFWRLEAGDRRAEGSIGFVGRGEGRVAVRLVNAEAVNLVLVMPESDADEIEVEEALLAFGLEPTCALVLSEPPFRLRVASSGDGWLAGRYEGILACPDYTALPVRGTFRVPVPEGS